MTGARPLAMLFAIAACSPAKREPPPRPTPPAAAAARIVKLHAPGAQIDNLAVGDVSTYALNLHDPPDCAAVQNTKGATHVSLVFTGPAYGDGQAAMLAATRYANEYVGKPHIDRVAIYDGDDPVPFFEGPPKTAEITVRREGSAGRARIVLVVDDPKVSLAYDGEVALCPTAQVATVADAGVAAPTPSSACPAAFAKGGALCTPSGKACEFPEGTCTCAGQSYCGGAAPHPETLKQLAVPRWICAPSPKVLGPDGCPLGMPNGGACKTPGKKCHYTPCCAFAVTCTNGKWVSNGGSCPP